MPVRMGRYDNIKIYRPAGARYSTNRQPVTEAYGKYVVGISETVERVVRMALYNFTDEFNQMPGTDTLVVEVTISAGIASATVFELPD